MRKRKSITTYQSKIKIPPLSEKEKRVLLRQGKAYELVQGGTWYYKSKDGKFERVVTDEYNLNNEGYREFVNNSSKLGFLFVNRDRPNYSLTKWCHAEEELLIKKLET